MSSCGYAYVGHVPVTLGGEEENGHGPDSGLFNMAGKQRTVRVLSKDSNNSSIVQQLPYSQEAQLSQRGRAMPRVVEYFG